MNKPQDQDQAALTLKVDGDGVAWLVFDTPGAKVNLLSTPVLERLDVLLGEIEAGAEAGDIRVVVIHSGKPGTFIAGADVAEIAAITDVAEAEAGSLRGQAIFRRLELLAVPTLAVVDGICLGGGTELILACGHRIASDRPTTRIGFPEVRLGILPGFGGTTRLPRLIGLQAALPLLLTGKPVAARKALRIGLVEEVVPVPTVMDRAAQLARDLATDPHPPRRRRSLMHRLVNRTMPGRRTVLQLARRQVLRETHGHYPAPLAILSTLRTSLPLPVDAAFQREARAVARLVVTPVSKNLIHVFHLTEGARKAALPDVTPRTVERAAVVGAGVMGGGIAQLLALHDIGVRLKDIQPEAIANGLRHARRLFDRLVKRHRLVPREARQHMHLIAPTLGYAGFGEVDLVVEAVVERLDVKQQVLRELESKVRAGTVLTSNTSSLSISEMQSVLARPQDFCGMHFFNPVHRMPLVEVIRGEATGTAAVATVVALALRLGKTPVIVNDGPGFLVNRILTPYLNEAGWLLAEGAAVAAVDRALTSFGMPMGPLRLLDEVGLDVARHAATVMHEACGARMRPAPPLAALQGTPLLGRKGGLGFYRYEGDRQQGVNDKIYGALGDAVPLERVGRPAEEIRERCVLAMVNEAAQALADGIVASPGAVDLAMITGTGFPPFRGGLLRYADTLGTAVVLARLEELSEGVDARFEPAPLLRELGRDGRGFYD